MGLSPLKAFKKHSPKIFSNFLFVSFTSLPPRQWPLYVTPPFFPQGLISLYLCFRVATAMLWIMETPHPYGKQLMEAQMLAHKHTSVSVSILWWANSRWQRLVSRRHRNNSVTCTVTCSSHTRLHAVFRAILLQSGVCVFYVFSLGHWCTI